SSLAQYDRMNLIDDRVLLHQEPPHHTEQKPPGYAPRLLVNTDMPGGFFPPYPFPVYLPAVTPTGLINIGGVYASPPSYTGSLTLPTFNPLHVYSGAATVGTSMKFYTDPEPPVVSINKYLPGVNITGLSITRLLNEINRAFIPTERPDY